MMMPVQIWADTQYSEMRLLASLSTLNILVLIVISDICVYLVTVHGPSLVVEAPRLAPAGPRVEGGLSAGQVAVSALSAGLLQ